jgi:hypothetical protein
LNYNDLGELKIDSLFFFKDKKQSVSIIISLLIIGTGSAIHHYLEEYN